MYILTHKIYLEENFIKLWFLCEIVNWLIQLDLISQPIKIED